MSPANPSADAWLVDLDGTLYAQKPIKRAMAIRLLVAGAWNIPTLSAFRKAHEELREELRLAPETEFAPSPFEEQVKRAARSRGTSEDKVRSTVMDWMVNRPAPLLRAARNESLVEEIRSFRKNGGRTALVSDYPAKEKLRGLELTELFDVVVASGETEGLTRLKPAPDSYLLAAKKLDTPAERCLVIGDRVDADGEAASSAKMEFRLVRAR